MENEFSPPPPFLKGTDVLNNLQDFQHALERKERDQLMDHEKKSIFLELPYWQHSLLRHNLDVTHIEKNIVYNILGTLLYISCKTKDHANARYELKDIEIRKNLHQKDTEDSKREILQKHASQ